MYKIKIYPDTFGAYLKVIDTTTNSSLTTSEVAILLTKITNGEFIIEPTVKDGFLVKEKNGSKSTV